MIIKEILAELKTKEHPIAKALYKTDAFKVLAIAFKKGMVLKEHSTSLPSKLIVMQGAIQYKNIDIERFLHQYDDHVIPANETHFVEAIEDSLCILIQGWGA
jgi:quercetin dioxygenase-like cupin family protein